MELVYEMSVASTWINWIEDIESWLEKPLNQREPASSVQSHIGPGYLVTDKDSHCPCL